MGTRADFYVGKNEQAEWLGSIAWDGYREGIEDAILQATTEDSFRSAVTEFLKCEEDATLPEMGWPWPWNDSRTSDCSYWFFDGQTWDAHGNRVVVYCPCREPIPDSEDLYEKWLAGRDPIRFPDMSKRKKVTLGPRSGLIVIT